MCCRFSVVSWGREGITCTWSVTTQHALRRRHLLCCDVRRDLPSQIWKSLGFYFSVELDFVLVFQRFFLPRVRKEDVAMAQYKGAASEAGRAMQLMKKREKEREQLEQLKQKIAEVHNFSHSLLTYLEQVCGHLVYLRANVVFCLWWNVNIRCSIKSPSTRYMQGQWRHHR